MNAIILFILCTAVNVILSTIKSILTVKGNKWVAALINALTYGFYSYVIILTNIEGISTLTKMGITAACNFVGVLIVKDCEERFRKDRLWKIEFTVKGAHTAEDANAELEHKRITHSYFPAGSHYVFNCYCATKRESEKVREVIRAFNGKYFITESKSF